MAAPQPSGRLRHQLELPPGGGLPALAVHLDAEIVSGTPDLDRIGREVAFLVEHGRHPDLDTAARVLARWLQLPPTGDGAALGALTLRLTPDTGAPVVLRAAPSPYDQEPDKPWGWVDIAHETATVGFYRLVLTHGGVLPTHVHQVMEEVELVLDDGLEGWRDGGPARPLPAGLRLRWRHGQPHGYRHLGGPPASLLCIDTPPFDPEDEKILDEEPP
jgi:mannose-6-phosphate isomerase-like protein (cupin superfamily)